MDEVRHDQSQTPSTRSRHIAMVATIAFLICVRSVSFQFTNWDDHLLILENPDVLSLSSEHLVAPFTKFYVNHYHPIVILSFAIDAALGGMAPGMFHLTNVLLQTLNCVLVYVLAERLLKKSSIAFASALLFAVHPVHIEAIGWISARKDLLSTTFMLLGLYSYASANASSITRNIWTGAFFIFALLSKAIAVVFPFLLLIVDQLQSEGQKIRWREKIPFFILSAIFSVVAYSAQYSSGVMPFSHAGGIGTRLAIPFYGLVSYLTIFVAPISLSPFYPFPSAIGDELPVIAWFCPLFVGIIGILAWEQRSRYLARVALLLFYVVSILPVLQMFIVGRAMFADRFLYLPSVGLCMLAGSLFNDLLERTRVRTVRQLTMGAAAVVLGLFAWQANRQLDVWSSSLSLWNAAIESYPTVAESYSKRASALLEMDKKLEAHADLNKAVELSPAEPGHYLNRALSYLRLGKQDSAMMDLRMAYRLDPNLPVFEGPKKMQPIKPDSLK